MNSQNRGSADGTEVRVERPLATALRLALHEGVNSGLAAASAMVVQVLFLMPIDSIVTYQYGYGAR